MLKRLISLFLAFLTGAVFYDRIAHTEVYKNAQFNTAAFSKTSWSDIVASGRVGYKAGEEMSDKAFAKFLK